MLDVEEYEVVIVLDAILKQAREKCLGVLEALVLEQHIQIVKDVAMLIVRLKRITI